MVDCRTGRKSAGEKNVATPVTRYASLGVGVINYFDIVSNNLIG